MAPHTCDICGLVFYIKREYVRHAKNHCNVCKLYFKNPYQLKFHQKNHGYVPGDHMSTTN